MAGESKTTDFEAAFWSLFVNVVSKCYLSDRDTDKELLEGALQAASRLDARLMYQKVREVTGLYFAQMADLSGDKILDLKCRLLDRAFMLSAPNR